MISGASPACAAPGAQVRPAGAETQAVIHERGSCATIAGEGPRPRTITATMIAVFGLQCLSGSFVPVVEPFDGGAIEYDAYEG